jgi:membrane protein implicated in regulation of membrane protease activity
MAAPFGFIVSFFLFILASLVAVFLSYAVLTSRRHKRHPSNASLLAATAIVDRELSPNGTALVNGELWPARSNDESVMSSGTVGKVIGLMGHRLVIEADPRRR